MCLHVGHRALLTAFNFGAHAFRMGANFERTWWTTLPVNVNTVGQLTPVSLNAFYQGGLDPSSPSSDFTLLERNERWSLYCHYRNGDTRLMIQLSEIKPENRGFANPHYFADKMYDYLSGRYGVRFEEEEL